MQVEAPSAENQPAWQFAQLVLAGEAVTNEALPASHGVQTVDPCAEAKLPIAHATHQKEPAALEYLPAAHGVHALLPRLAA